MRDQNENQHRIYRKSYGLVRHCDDKMRACVHMFAIYLLYVCARNLLRFFRCCCCAGTGAFVCLFSVLRSVCEFERIFFARVFRNAIGSLNVSERVRNRKSRVCVLSTVVEKHAVQQSMAENI